MTEETIKESLGMAYTRAVAAYAGMNITVSEHDYGYDGTFIDIEYDEEYKSYSPSGFEINFQLKSTEKFEIKNDFIFYNLRVKNYRDLIKNKGNSRILVLYLMPHDRAEWLVSTTSHLIMKQGAWWYSLEGMSQTSNEHTIQIKIPFSNFLDADTLKDLMQRVKVGERI